MSGPPRAHPPRLRRARRMLVVTGGLVLAYAMVGGLTDPDFATGGVPLFLVATLLAHDAVVLPAAIGAGVLIGRYVPAAARVSVRVAAFVSAAVMVVALPLVLGFGRRSDDPSSLPQPYGRGLTVVLVLIWTVALVAVAMRRRPARRRPPG